MRKNHARLAGGRPREKSPARTVGGPYSTLFGSGIPDFLIFPYEQHPNLSEKSRRAKNPDAPGPPLRKKVLPRRLAAGPAKRKSCPAGRGPALRKRNHARPAAAGPPCEISRRQEIWQAGAEFPDVRKFGNAKFPAAGNFAQSWMPCSGPS